MEKHPDTIRTTLIKRHSLPVRVTHWINAACVLVLLASGLQIFNAHPALYLGEDSDFDHPVLVIGATQSAQGELRGHFAIGGISIPTTGILGASQSASGRMEARAFPGWATLPSGQDLASGRRWHFFFAWIFVLNGAVYLIYALASRHAWHNVLPRFQDLRGIGGAVLDHLHLRFPKDAGRYNVLQKLSYAGIVFVLLPILVVAGWAMSPGLNAAFPWMPEMFGGRQSARTAHFLAATVLVLFVVVHIVMVLVSGPLNSMGSMLTGRYRIHTGGAPDERC